MGHPSRAQTYQGWEGARAGTVHHPHPPFLPRLLLQTWDLFHSHFKSNTLPEQPLVPRCENWWRSGRCALPGPACLSCVPAPHPAPGPQVLEIRLAAREAGAPEGFNEAKPRGRSENQCQLSTKPAFSRATVHKTCPWPGEPTLIVCSHGPGHLDWRPPHVFLRLGLRTACRRGGGGRPKATGWGLGRGGAGGC